MAYLPMVRSMAARLHQRLPPYILLEDLESYGLVGVHEALTRYIPMPHARFRTYLYAIIRGRMKDGLLADYPNCRWRPFDRPTARRRCQLRWQTEQLSDAAAHAIPARDDQPAPAAELIRRDLLDSIEEGLTRMERLVLRCYFLDNLSTDQIAAVSGYSYGTIFNIAESLLARLRARADLRALAGLKNPTAAPIAAGATTAREARELIHGHGRIHTNRKRWPVRRKGAASASREGARRQGSPAGATVAQSGKSPAQDGHASHPPIPLIQPAQPSARKVPGQRAIA